MYCEHTTQFPLKSIWRKCSLKFTNWNKQWQNRAMASAGKTLTFRMLLNCVNTIPDRKNTHTFCTLCTEYAYSENHSYMSIHYYTTYRTTPIILITGVIWYTLQSKELVWEELVLILNRKLSRYLRLLSIAVLLVSLSGAHNTHFMVHG